MSYFIFALSLALFAWTYVTVRRERQRTQALRREVEGAVDELVLAAEEAVRTIEEKRRELADLHVARPVVETVPAEDPPEPVPGEAPPAVSQRLMDPVQERVLVLAKEGRPMVEIAREMGLTTGKVELILNLRRLAG